MTDTHDTQTSDSHQFHSLLIRHQSKLKALLFCLIFDKEDAMEVFQDVNITLLDKADQYDHDRDFGNG